MSLTPQTHDTRPTDDEAPTSRTTVTIEISRRTIALLAAAGIGFWAMLNLRDSLTVLFSAVVLASAIERPVAWLEHHRVRRPFGVAACYLILAGVLTSIILLLIPLVASEFNALKNELPRYANGVEDAFKRISPQASDSSPITVTNLFSALGTHLDAIAVQLTQLSARTGHVLVLAFVTFVCAYYLAVSPASTTQAIQRFVHPAHRARVAWGAEEVRQRIGGWAAGQALVAASFGLGMGVGLWLLGIPYAVSLGVVAALLELIPYIGGAVTLLLAIPLALQLSIPHAIAVLVLYGVLVNVEAHILAPYFLGRAAKLPPFIVLLALIAGAELAGVIGILLAVPMTVVLWTLIDAVWPTRSQPE